MFSREIKSESNANEIALTSKKWRDRNGNFTGDPLRGLSLTWLHLILCAITCLNSNKRWKYVYMCLLPSSSSFLKREWWDKSYTRTWEKFKIGRWYNHSPGPRVLFGFGTCDMTPLNGGILEVYHVNVSTHVWLTIFKWPSKLRSFSYP